MKNKSIRDILHLPKKPVTFSNCYCFIKEGRKHRIQDTLHWIYDTSSLTNIENSPRKETWWGKLRRSTNYEFHDFCSNLPWRKRNFVQQKKFLQPFFWAFFASHLLNCVCSIEVATSIDKDYRLPLYFWQGGRGRKRERNCFWICLEFN